MNVQRDGFLVFTGSVVQPPNLEGENSAFFGFRDRNTSLEAYRKVSMPLAALRRDHYEERAVDQSPAGSIDQKNVSLHRQSYLV